LEAYASHGRQEFEHSIKYSGGWSNGISGKKAAPRIDRSPGNRFITIQERKSHYNTSTSNDAVIRVPFIDYVLARAFHLHVSTKYAMAAPSLVQPLGALPKCNEAPRSKLQGIQAKANKNFSGKGFSVRLQ
jgi:hypothetical protein